MDLFKRIKDRKKFAELLRERGHKGVPDHDDDRFHDFVTPLLTSELVSSMPDHFDAPSYDSSPTMDFSSSVETSSTFDAGGGASGGGGADGSW